ACWALLRFNTPKLSRLWPVPVKSKTIAPRLVRRFVCADPISKEGKAALGGRHGETDPDLCSRHIRPAADRRHDRRSSRPDGKPLARPAGADRASPEDPLELWRISIPGRC